MIWFVIGIAVGVMITYIVNRYKNTNTVTKQVQLTTNERRLLELIENTRDCLYYFETKPKWRHTYKRSSFEKILGKEKGKLAYEQLEYRSTHDGLTNVYNRHFFEDLIKKYNQNEDVSIGIVICDLDELKRTNDTLGHKQGDHLIKDAANLMNTYSRDNVIVSRIGGDEFALLITNIDKIRVEELVERLRRETRIYNKGSNKLAIRLSIGYAYSNQSIGKLESLFVEADRNMYEDKQRRKNKKLVFM